MNWIEVSQFVRLKALCKATEELLKEPVDVHNSTWPKDAIERVWYQPKTFWTN